MVGDEDVIAAWSETPRMLLPELLGYVLAIFTASSLLVYWPESLGGPVISPMCSSKPFCPFFTMLVVAVVMIGVIVAWRHVSMHFATQCAVIVTDQRVLTVCHQKFLCNSGMALRVEMFCHDRGVWYSRMNTRSPSFLERIQGSDWRPGEIVMQSIFGVLKLSRMQGNADDVYRVIQLLSQKSEAEVSEVTVAAAVGGTVCREDCLAELEQNGEELTIMGEDDHGYPQPEEEKIWLLAGETPVFHWQFQEAGLLTSAYNTKTDLIVTTDRIIIWARGVYKTFDCRTCCCYGFWWCACMQKLFGTRYLPHSMSYLNLSRLQGFSTETTLLPPYLPITCPCYDTICTVITRFVTCQRLQCCQPDDDCSCIPYFTPPKTQLWLKFMQMYAKTAQPDLVVSIRPYSLPEFTQKQHGLCHGSLENSGSDSDEESPKMHYDDPKLIQLRKIMHLIMKMYDEQQNAEDLDPVAMGIGMGRHVRKKKTMSDRLDTLVRQGTERFERMVGSLTK
eukprot:gnl/MRDRNA2_/MRDRNA2_191219_c0_seq1.p1 gnl/MRDRNA2_/MRDRNA2_191219_c0~~gnl/MRDRNA2_/MRDRNA2_191219_c0_seq1.p1  ORF type:complete len:565 (-),score=87.67 gnl/MRDRNA2_/MRDRNA2_191219_c0_seq1:379-1893(-)